jgi:hypothetical protein
MGAAGQTGKAHGTGIHIGSQQANRGKYRLNILE